ncbi:SDR family oxidoreductase [Allosalinactinospora lopnorensis]|uniref:SDR family oxidoreductase n=1 Tax=Allosalinactinospora lopnorensis TaxID=1352348 RepID=UPI000623FB8D|nr:NAD(P)H-binding protein [Allosalinactinospora lopnorensis]
MDTTLVTGGSGTLGRHVLRRLVEAGTEPHVVARRSAPGWSNGTTWFTVDLADGRGLDQALDGCRTVLHCASDTVRHTKDITQAGNLLSAAARAGVEHIVYVSIVGIDRLPYGYYRTKLAVEELVEESGLGYTILRATQFHELLAWILKALNRAPTVPVPARTYLQPIAAEEVAEQLVELVKGPPRKEILETGGPEVKSARELADIYLSVHHARARTAGIPIPGRIGSALRSGALLAPEHRYGRQTWRAFLTGESPDREPG